MSGLADHTEAPAAAAEAAKSSDSNAGPGLLERARMRRRARFLRQLRELQLRDLGGFLLEQLRLGRENPAVVQSKLADAGATDRELRALEGALGQGRPLREVREPGVGGACSSCGTVYGSADRYCSWCGREL